MFARALAQTILDGTYEATLAAAAILSQKRKTRVKVFLTQVGGGVFGNDEEWILNAITRSLETFQRYPLDVFLVHYPSVPSDPANVFMQLERCWRDSTSSGGN